VRLAPEHDGALYLLGLIEKQADNTARSAQLLEKVVKLDPRNGDAYFALGQNYAKLDKTKEAIASWKRAIEINPNHAQALYSLSRAPESDPAEAERYRSRFAELQRTRQLTDRAETLSNFALSSAAARDWPQAVAQLKEAIEVCGECRSRATLHKNLGLIYCRSGEIKSGIVQLREARRLNPKDPEIETALRIVDKQ